MSNYKSIGQIILFSVIGLAVAWFITTRIIAMVKANKPPPNISNGSDNPDNFYASQKSSGVPLAQNQYTLATVDSAGKIQPTDATVKLLEGLEKELYPNLYTSDDAVISYMELCKTVADLAFLNLLWNGTISEKHSGDLLLTRISQKLSSSNNQKLTDYINNLPDTV